MVFLTSSASPTSRLSSCLTLSCYVLSCSHHAPHAFLLPQIVVLVVPAPHIPQNTCTSSSRMLVSCPPIFSLKLLREDRFPTRPSILSPFALPRSRLSFAFALDRSDASSSSPVRSLHQTCPKSSSSCSCTFCLVLCNHPIHVAVPRIPALSCLCTPSFVIMCGLSRRQRRPTTLLATSNLTPTSTTTTHPSHSILIVPEADPLCTSFQHASPIPPHNPSLRIPLCT